MFEYYIPGFSEYLESLASGEGRGFGGYSFPAAEPTYYAPPTPQPVAAEPYYEEPTYYAPPTPQPVAAEPYYGEPSYYAEPSYSLPTAQRVAAEPYYEAPSYSLPTAQPVYSEPFLGGLSAPTLSEQPVTAEPYYGEPSYSLPTAQPVMAEPFLGGLSAPTRSEQPVAAEPYYAEPSYSLPTAQPVAAEPYYEAPSYSLPTAQPMVAQAAPVYPEMPADYAQRAEENARRAYDLAAQESFGARGELSKALDRIDTSSDFNYSPAAAQYLYDVGRYPTENTEYELSPMNLMKVDPQTGAPLPYTSSQLEQYAQQPLADQFYANFAYGGPGSEWDVGALQFAPNQQYRLIDRSTGDVVYTGTGYEAGKNISQLAKGMFDKSGQQANWAIQQAAPGSDQWTQRYEHVPDVNGFNVWLKMVAPMLGGALAAPLGLAGNLGAAAGSAIGSAGAGIASGDSLGDILKNAALSGVSSYAAGELLGKLGAGKTPPSTGGLSVDDFVSMGVSPTSAANIVGGLGGALPTDIVVTGTGGTGALSGFGGTLANIPSAALTTGPEPRRPDYGDKVEDTQQPVEDQIVVTGTKAPIMPTPGLPSVAAPFVPGALDAVAPPSETIIAEGARKPEAAAPVPVPAFTPGALDAVAPPSDEIVVSKRNEPAISPGIAASTIASAAPSLNAPTTPAETTPAPKEKTTLEKVQDIADYMQLAGLGIGALGSLFGGGQQTAAKIANASGLGGLNPTFSAKLPGANIPGLGAGSIGGGPRTAADLGQQGMTSPQDYYRYGYGPEQSFFGYVPQGAPNTSQAYTGYAKGGFAVEGPGDGREDKIPAMLSDGEYVIDAETVALLGNGSNKAGADMLDQFRVKVRKHKGRELARGKFSKNAKRPEQYLGGGRA